MRTCNAGNARIRAFIDVQFKWTQTVHCRNLRFYPTSWRILKTVPKSNAFPLMLSLFWFSHHPTCCCFSLFQILWRFFPCPVPLLSFFCPSPFILIWHFRSFETYSHFSCTPRNESSPHLQKCLVLSSCSYWSQRKQASDHCYKSCLSHFCLEFSKGNNSVSVSFLYKHRSWKIL